MSDPAAPHLGDAMYSRCKFLKYLVYSYNHGCGVVVTNPAACKQGPSPNFDSPSPAAAATGPTFKYTDAELKPPLYAREGQLVCVTVISGKRSYCGVNLHRSGDTPTTFTTIYSSLPDTTIIVNVHGFWRTYIQQ